MTELTPSEVSADSKAACCLPNRSTMKSALTLLGPHSRAASWPNLPPGSSMLNFPICGFPYLKEKLHVRSAVMAWQSRALEVMDRDVT